MSIAKHLCLQGAVVFSAGMLQGFSIPMLENSRLALVAHSKTVLHALTLMGFGAAFGSGVVQASGSAETAIKVLLVGGAWGSFIGDVMASVTGVTLPLAAAAARSAGQPAKVDPAEEDYAVEKSKRKKPSGGPPAISTALIKVSYIISYHIMN